MITSWGWIYINKGFPGHISSILQKLLKNLINLFLKIIFYAITYKPMLVFQFLIEIYNYIELLKWGFLYCSNEVFSSLNQEFFFQLVYNVLVLLVILFGTFFLFFLHIPYAIWLFSISDLLIFTFFLHNKTVQCAEMKPPMVYCLIIKTFNIIADANKSDYIFTPFLDFLWHK